MTIIYDTPEMLASKMDRQQHRASLLMRLMTTGPMAGNDNIVVLDMSYWINHELIDYGLLAENVHGVILRGVYGIWKDTRFDIHYNNLYKRNIPIGVYAYLIGNKTGEEQANALYNAVDQRELPMGIWSDIEDQRQGTKLTRPVAEQFMAYADDMFDTITDIYTGPYAWSAIMKTGGHSYRKLWLANYLVNSPRMPIGGDWTSWWLWQYTDRGRYPGYKSGLDASKWHGTDLEYYDWVNKSSPTPLTAEQKLDTVYKWWEEYHTEIENVVK